jgi:hypothetical protein
MYYWHRHHDHLQLLSKIRTPLRKQVYGDWEFEVKDPKGYILVFSELID